MTDEIEVSETASRMAAAPRRIEWDKLPTNTRGVARLAAEAGWLVSAWESAIEYGPALYITTANGHDAGDVKKPGYTARVFTVEARAKNLPLGFHAHFEGKVGSTTPLKFARIADPVGLAFPLGATYKPIRQQRGKYETAASFNRRVAAALLVAQEQDRDYNDGALTYSGDRTFYQIKLLIAWLSEWHSIFQTTTTKKAS